VAQAQQHTILLIQKTKLKSSRTFTDHESIGHSLERTLVFPRWRRGRLRRLTTPMRRAQT
jgi:hypothetical protein